MTLGTKIESSSMANPHALAQRSGASDAVPDVVAAPAGQSLTRCAIEPFV